MPLSPTWPYSGNFVGYGIITAYERRIQCLDTRIIFWDAMVQEYKQANKNRTARGYKVKHFNLTSHIPHFLVQGKTALLVRSRSMRAMFSQWLPISIIVEMFTYSPDIPRKTSFSWFFFRASVFDKLVLTNGQLHSEIQKPQMGHIKDYTVPRLSKPMSLLSSASCTVNIPLDFFRLI